MGPCLVLQLGEEADRRGLFSLSFGFGLGRFWTWCSFLDDGKEEGTGHFQKANSSVL